MGHKVLITRPIDQALSFAQSVSALGGDPVLCPLLTIETYAYKPVLDITPSALLITSTHGLPEYIPPLWQDLPVFVVGESVAKAAQERGLNHIKAIAKDARDLVPILAVTPYHRILYWRGEDITFVFADYLPDKEVVEHITYCASSLAQLPKVIINQFHELQTVTLFSSRTARIFSDVVFEAGLSTHLQHINLLCLSQAVLDSVSCQQWASVHIAPAPTQTAMIDVLKGIIQSQP